MRNRFDWSPCEGVVLHCQPLAACQVGWTASLRYSDSRHGRKVVEAAMTITSPPTCATDVEAAEFSWTYGLGELGFPPGVPRRVVDAPRG